MTIPPLVKNRSKPSSTGKREEESGVRQRAVINIRRSVPGLISLDFKTTDPNWYIQDSSIPPTALILASFHEVPFLQVFYHPYILFIDIGYVQLPTARLNYFQSSFDGLDLFLLASSKIWIAINNNNLPLQKLYLRCFGQLQSGGIGLSHSMCVFLHKKEKTSSSSADHDPVSVQHAMAMIQTTRSRTSILTVVWQVNLINHQIGLLILYVFCNSLEIERVTGLSKLLE